MQPASTVPAPRQGCMTVVSGSSQRGAARRSPGTRDSRAAATPAATVQQRLLLLPPPPGAQHSCYSWAIAVTGTRAAIPDPLESPDPQLPTAAPHRSHRSSAPKAVATRSRSRPCVTLPLQLHLYTASSPRVPAQRALASEPSRRRSHLQRLLLAAPGLRVE